MAAAVGLRADFTATATALRQLAQSRRDAGQVRRLLALAVIYDGGSRSEVARVGQKNGITRRWARRGTRPSALKDRRTTSAYIYGAICPAEGKGAALVLPRCNTEGMTLHLAEISAAVAPGAECTGGGLAARGRCWR